MICLLVLNGWISICTNVFALIEEEKIVLQSTSFIHKYNANRLCGRKITCLMNTLKHSQRISLFSEDDYFGTTQTGEPHKFKQHFCTPGQSLSISHICPSQRYQLASVPLDEGDGQMPFLGSLSLGTIH